MLLYPCSQLNDVSFEVELVFLNRLAFTYQPVVLAEGLQSLLCCTCRFQHPIEGHDIPG